MSNAYQYGANSVPPDFVTVNQSDLPYTVEFDAARAFRVGTGGDVELVTFDGRTVVVPTVQDGELHVGLFTQILAGNTTADGITVYK